MEGDGVTEVLHCEYAEFDLTREPDANPVYCEYRHRNADEELPF